MIKPSIEVNHSEGTIRFVIEMSLNSVYHNDSAYHCLEEMLAPKEKIDLTKKLDCLKEIVKIVEEIDG